MTSLSEVKSHLDELEDQKKKLIEAKQKANKRYKLSLWGVGLGIILLPLYWSGLPVLFVAGVVALVYSVKQAGYQDKLESLETEIHQLEISMA